MPIIVLEGTDSSGKATNAALLEKRINATGREAVVFSFPRYETAVGKAILRLLKNETTLIGEGLPHAADEALALQSLFVVDKYDAAADMNSHLRAGRIVICDRWTPSALAFGAADGLNTAWLNRVQERLPKGDVNIFIDVPEEEALKRRPKLRDRYEKNRELQIRVRENYRSMWASGGIAWKTVDGVGTIEEVHERIWEIVRGLVIGGSSR